MCCQDGTCPRCTQHERIKVANARMVMALCKSCKISIHTGALAGTMSGMLHMDNGLDEGLVIVPCKKHLH